MSEYPNFFSSTALFTETTGGSVVKGFGFQAQFVRVVNRGAASLWLNVQNVAATTHGLEVVSSGDVTIEGTPGIAGVGLFHPNMSTTTTGTVLEAGVSAWGVLRSV